ncbi:hypothetical protein L596_014595 [Steinernema carpocapsae]|uniref:Uncharacterized protein n=1 Tax=Steinernema carpocapsae TaxID=34508 RepID=A0A4U5ND93_STECR|nr:hypothetical protein L596_014595 [Steinernema carpocapsae]
MPSASPDSSAERVAEYSQQLDSLLDFGSKALNGIVSNMAAPAHDASGNVSHEPRNSSPLASLASMLTGGGGEGGGMCFKTCGMEDIQFAAVKAGELFISLRFCVLVLTVITVCCMLTLTTVLAYHFLRSRVRIDDSQRSSPIPLIGRNLSLFSKNEKTSPPKELADSEKSSV